MGVLEKMKTIIVKTVGFLISIHGWIVMKEIQYDKKQICVTDIILLV